MSITAAQIAALIGGKIEGNPDAKIRRPNRIEEAVEGDFSFLDNPKYENHVYTTHASVLLVSHTFVPTQPVAATLIRVENVRACLAALMEKFGQTNTHTGISPQAFVHPTATVGTPVTISHFAVVEEGAVIGEGTILHPQVFVGKNAKIGKNCVLHTGVKIYHDCVVGDNCLLHANAVIGSDGFGFAPMEDGTWKKMPHLGNVVLGNNIEIGACACIDRAAMGSTTLHDGVKLDNLVHIAHNVQVGKNTVMAAQVGVAGSTKTGEGSQFGGQAGLAGHLTLANKTRLGAQTGLGHDTKEDTAYFGSPAFVFNDYMRSHVIFKSLPTMERRLRKLEKSIDNLSPKLEGEINNNGQ